VFSLRRQRRCSYRICTRQCCWPRCTFTFIAILNIYSLPELLLLLHPFNGLLQHLFMSTNIHSTLFQHSDKTTAVTIDTCASTAGLEMSPQEYSLTHGSGTLEFSYRYSYSKAENDSRQRENKVK